MQFICYRIGHLLSKCSTRPTMLTKPSFYTKIVQIISKLLMTWLQWSRGCASLSWEVNYCKHNWIITRRHSNHSSRLFWFCLSADGAISTESEKYACWFQCSEDWEATLVICGKIWTLKSIFSQLKKIRLQFCWLLQYFSNDCQSSTAVFPAHYFRQWLAVPI